MGITNILGIVAFLIKNWSTLQALWKELQALLNGQTTSTTTSAPSILSEIIAILEGKAVGNLPSPIPGNSNAPAGPSTPSSPIRNGGILGGILGSIFRRRK